MLYVVAINNIKKSRFHSFCFAIYLFHLLDSNSYKINNKILFGLIRFLFFFKLQILHYAGKSGSNIFQDSSPQ